MPNTIQFFRKNFLTFTPIFVQAGQIIKMIENGKSTDNMIQNCADIMVMKHHKMMKDPDVIKFMNLIATARYSRSIMRPFLKELILSALDQAIGRESGLEPHTICVRKDILLNSKIDEKVKKLILEKTDISDFSKKITAEIPQITGIFIDGVNTRKELRFSLCYNSLLRMEFDPLKKRQLAI